MSLAKTYFQDIRVNAPSGNDRDELRITTTGLLSMVLDMTNSASSVVSPDLKQKALTSVGLNLDIPVMQKGSVTISNVRSCTIAGGQSESDLVRVVWKTIAADIMMVPSQYKKNQITYQADLAQKINEMVEAFAVEIEGDLDTALDANKTQVYGSTIVGTTYALTGGAIQVTKDDAEWFFNDLAPINFSDDFNSNTVRVVASPNLMSSVSRYVNQGSANNTNTSFQFAGKIFTFSNRITNDAGVIATGYFMPEGTIGLITRIDLDSQANAKATDGTEWFEEMLPGLPFPVGVQYKSKCDDKSALEVAGLAHLKATLVEHYQISFDFAIIVPYNSDNTTKAGAIRKFEFVPNP